METDFSDGQTFRFHRLGVGPDIYIAIRQNSLWSVSIEGNTKMWLCWLLSDSDVRNRCWDYRLTD